MSRPHELRAPPAIVPSPPSLPGHTLAFNIGMAGWVLRLALYTVGGAEHACRACMWVVLGQRVLSVVTVTEPLHSFSRSRLPPLHPQLLPLFPSLWCVVPVELLQGLTFAVGKAGAVQRNACLGASRQHSSTAALGMSSVLLAPPHQGHQAHARLRLSSACPH